MRQARWKKTNTARCHFRNLKPNQTHKTQTSQSLGPADLPSVHSGHGPPATQGGPRLAHPQGLADSSLSSSLPLGPLSRFQDPPRFFFLLESSGPSGCCVPCPPRTVFSGPEEEPRPWDPVPAALSLCSPAQQVSVSCTTCLLSHCPPTECLQCGIPQAVDGNSEMMANTGSPARPYNSTRRNSPRGAW